MAHHVPVNSIAQIRLTNLEGWNAENLSFYALVTDENGYVNNLAVCKAIDGDADYEYVND
jgi:hypothetical protein